MKELKTSPLLRLWISIIFSGLIYLAFTLPFPLIRFYAVNPPVDYAKLTRYSSFGFGAYLVGITALFGLYVLALRSLAASRTDLIKNNMVRFVLLSGAGFALIVFLSYPQTAIDVLVYALRTRGWARYGLSPFSTSPQGFPVNDPWLGLAGEWADAASPYGPVWEWLSLGAYYLSGGSFLAHLFALKAIGFLAYLGSAWLIYQILRRLHPQHALLGLAFFAWNPLVLLESVQNGHNDMVMVFFLLAAIWAYLRLMQADQPSWWFSTLFIGAFSLSILVKFITLMILPFFLLGLASRQRNWPGRLGALLLYGSAIALVSSLLMLPYWPGWENWAVLQSSQGAGRSLTALLVLAFREIPGVANALAFDYTQGLIYLLLGGIYLWGLRQVFSQGFRDPQRITNHHEPVFESSLRASFYVFFCYILLAASVFHAWYLLWSLPLAALLIPERRAISGAFVFSLAALMIIPYYETVRVWIPVLLQDHLWGHLIGVTLLLTPVLFSLWKPIQILPEQQL